MLFVLLYIYLQTVLRISFNIIANANITTPAILAGCESAFVSLMYVHVGPKHTQS